MKSGCKQMTDDAKRALEAIEQAIPETILGCNLVGPGPHTLEYFPNPARAALATIRAALVIHAMEYLKDRLAYELYPWPENCVPITFGVEAERARKGEA